MSIIDILIATFILFGNHNETKCDCKEYIVKPAENQKIIFIQKSLEDAEVVLFGTYLNTNNFSDLEFYKGQKKLNGHKLVKLSENISTCKFGFENGSKYFVFGKLNNQNELVTSICYANTKIINQKELEDFKRNLNQ